MDPPSSDVRMEAAPTPTPTGTGDPSPPQPSLQHQQSGSNPNSSFTQTTNMIQFNRQPSWVGSQQPAPQLSLLPPQLHSPGGFAIGVPANSPQVTPIPRNLDSSPSQARPSMPASMGMIGSHLRPAGVPQVLPQYRSVSPAIGQPHSTSNTVPAPSQNYPSHGILRPPPVAIPSSSTPSTSQSQQSPHQPWLSTQHGRPPMSSVRPPVTSQTSQPKTHMPQQSLQPIPANSQPQQMLSFPQQPHMPATIHSQDNNGQQLPSSRNPQPSTNQPQFSRVQTPSSASIVHSGPTNQIGSAENLDSCTRLLSKRNIQELVSQVDPLEKLDPAVEDVLVDIAEEFIDSVTTFGCSLAKHRKSNTLEAKDILLHLERTWNMTLPGFSGDEIRTYKKPVGNDIHKERLAVIKKSLTAPEANKSSAGQAAGSVKGHLTKPSNITGS